LSLMSRPSANSTLARPRLGWCRSTRYEPRAYAGRPFHAHEVFEDAWKAGPEDERTLWRGLAQLAVGLTHAARGNTTGGARLLRRGAGAVDEWRAGSAGRIRPYGLDLTELAAWARELATVVESDGAAVSAGAWAPRLRGSTR
ncbi:DUF309 domain-containing protein, partial [Streptomyces sp. NPDC006333]|uniref:DUF309 domain-containing protein n=1 Tax=Streptomyces sp. NPDC006333 TaxID=3156753 RepID=UPI0033A2EB33